MSRLLVIFVIAAASFGGSGAIDRRPDHIISFPDAGAELWVRVADSSDERSRGLMRVENLPPDEGMAFFWEEPVEATFWMKDTLIPLSIAFVDPDGRIITIADMEPCRADPCPTYAADGPFVLAVEANRGYFDEAGIVEGDRARLETVDA